MSISRRSVVGGLAAPIVTKASATTEDADLVALGEQFTDTIKLLFDDSEWWNNKMLLSRLGEIGTAIMDTPATTMQGLVVKARIAHFAQDTAIWWDIDLRFRSRDFRSPCHSWSI